VSFDTPRNKALAIYLAAALLALALLAFGARLVEQVTQARDSWSEHSSRASAAEAALHDVIRHFGYGGFIHNFKNYVLRYDAGLLLQLEDDLAGTRAALDRYQLLPLSPDEQAVLRDLRRVVDSYAGKLEVAKALVDQGLSPAVIDAQVRVDDKPALAALVLLEAHADKVLSSSRQHTEAALGDVVTQLQYGALLLLPIALVAVLLVRDRRHMHLAHQQLTQSARYIEDLIEGVPDALLVVEDGGRIRQVNVAAEKLLGYGRERLTAMTVEELMPGRYRHGHALLRDRARAAGHERPFGPETKLVALARDGHEIPVDISLSHSRQDGTLLTLVTLRDVSERERLRGLLEDREQALQAAQAIAHIGSWDWRIMSNELSWTDETYRIFGFEPQSFVTSYEIFRQHVHPDDRERVGRTVQAAVDQATPYDIEHRIIRRDGSERMVQQRAEVFRAEGGQPVRMIGTILDITERKTIERELLFDQAVIQGLSQPIVVVDADMHIVDLNDAYCEMSGYSRAELLGQSPTLLKSGRHDRDFYQQMWDSIRADQRWQGEMWIRRKDGSILPQLLSVTRICEVESGCCRYVGFYSDITSLKADQARLEKLAHFDPLTGLANRMLCHDRLRAAIARAHRSKGHVATLFIDLDGFKQVNDRLGHQTGDMLLVEVAERMKASVREDDTVARLGGDEFAVILNEVGDREDIRELAERVLQATQVTLGAGDTALTVSSSIGIARYPQNGETEDVLLELADQAMYQAKQAGKGRLAFYRAD